MNNLLQILSKIPIEFTIQRLTEIKLKTQLEIQLLYEMINITPPATVVQKTLNLSRYKRKKPASSVRPKPKKKSSRGIRAFHLSYSIFIYSSSSGFIYSSCLDFVSFIIKNELSGAEREHGIGPGYCFNLRIISCWIRSLYNRSLSAANLQIISLFFLFTSIKDLWKQVGTDSGR